MMKKTSNPFLVSNSELHEKLNLQFFNEIQSVPLKTLLNNKCLKVAGSSNFECDIKESKSKNEKDKDGSKKIASNPGILIF